jgi:hypothetical protein
MVAGRRELTSHRSLLTLTEVVALAVFIYMPVAA